MYRSWRPDNYTCPISNGFPPYSAGQIWAYEKGADENLEAFLKYLEEQYPDIILQLKASMTKEQWEKREFPKRTK